jgi:2-aminoadipate transaminase
MRNPADYLSANGRALRESAIRKASDLESAAPDLISLAGGFPDPSVFPWDDVREIARSVLDGSDPAVLQYGLTRGYRPLIEAAAEILRARNVQAAASEIIITSGSQQALDLCARVFVDPGDTVLVELPTYTGAMTAFVNQRARLAGVRQDGDGIDIDDLDRVFLRERAEGRRVALVYVVPNFQNPTGLLMSLERRSQLLDWARRHDTLIVEDDPYGVIYFDDVTTGGAGRPIKADDEEGRVIYLSTFSKTAAPGLRVAWVAGPAAIVARMEVAKQSADICTGSLDQRLAFELWKRGVLDRRLPLLREAYLKKRVAMEAALAREMGDLVSWSTPKGGFFIWVGINADIDTDILLKRAIRHGVLYVPGSAFYVDQHPGPEMRLSFSTQSPDGINAGIRRLAAAVREEIDASGRAVRDEAPGSSPEARGSSSPEAQGSSPGTQGSSREAPGTSGSSQGASPGSLRGVEAPLPAPARSRG